MTVFKSRNSADKFWLDILANIDPTPAIFPTVTTDDLNMLSSLNANIVGTVTSQGSDDLLSYGFVWATHDNPTLADNVIEVGTGSFTGEFETTTDPIFETEIYVAAYATSIVGTSYGAVLNADTEVGPKTISGAIMSPGEADVFSIYIRNPAAFSASTVGLAFFDTQLWLFNEDGVGVYANDDIGGGGGARSVLPAGNIYSPTTPGFYLLAITAFDTQARTASNAQIFIGASDAVLGPNTLSPLDHWTLAEAGGTGGYSINITGAMLAD